MTHIDRIIGDSHYVRIYNINIRKYLELFIWSDYIQASKYNNKPTYFDSSTDRLLIPADIIKLLLNIWT